MVYEYAVKYSFLLPDIYKDYVIASSLTHDTIEDTRETFNDVKKVCGEFVAEITYALTNDKGKTRDERAGAKYYEGIRNTPFATYIKICDRLANARYSFETRSSMLGKYRKELSKFKKELYTPEYEAMWIELDEILDEVTNYSVSFPIVHDHSCI
jgi:(p)ppGpp synthase/HD superfamily hydrolase